MSVAVVAVRVVAVWVVVDVRVVMVAVVVVAVVAEMVVVLRVVVVVVVDVVETTHFKHTLGHTSPIVNELPASEVSAPQNDGAADVLGQKTGSAFVHKTGADDARAG